MQLRCKNKKQQKLLACGPNKFAVYKMPVVNLAEGNKDVEPLKYEY